MPTPSRPQVISISPAGVAQTQQAGTASAQMAAAAAPAAGVTAATCPANGDRPGTPAPAAPPTPRWPQTLLALNLGAVILAAIAIAGVLAAAHARDRYWINIASGSWVALAWHAEHGTLYPPLRDAEGNFGGTRYMPLHVLAHAGLARVTGDILFSGRIIGFTCAIMWAAAIVALARQRGCPWLVALALAASVLASPVGIQALCTIRSDGMALALQLWALWFIARDEKPKSAIFAGLLCGLGFLAKLTAVWAALAIGLWLLWRNRASLAGFVITGLLVAGSSLAVLNLLTDGRLFDNLLQSGTSGWQGWGSVITWSQRRLLQFVSEWSPTTWVLVPPAALALLLAAAKRDLNVLHLAWIACCGKLAVMYADVGVGENHILALAAITAVVAGDLWPRSAAFEQSAAADSAIPARWNVAQLLLAVAVGWSSLAVIKQRLWRDVEGAIAALRDGRPSPENDPHALREVLDGRRFFSDDPTLAVLRDQKPVVNDAFMFRGFEASHPEWTEQLVARIAAREFEVIALSHEADPDSWWYRELFLGTRVTAAIRDHYRLERVAGDFHLYRPAK